MNNLTDSYIIDTNSAVNRTNKCKYNNVSPSSQILNEHETKHEEMLQILFKTRVHF